LFLDIEIMNGETTYEEVMNGIDNISLEEESQNFCPTCGNDSACECQRRGLNRIESEEQQELDEVFEREESEREEQV